MCYYNLKVLNVNFLLQQCLTIRTEYIYVTFFRDCCAYSSKLLFNYSIYHLFPFPIPVDLEVVNYTLEEQVKHEGKFLKTVWQHSR